MTGLPPDQVASHAERVALAGWVRRCGQAVVTMASRNGYPAMRRSPAWTGPDGAVELDEAPGAGPATLTFHSEGLGGVRLDALMARGWVHPAGVAWQFVPWRVVGFFGRQAGTRPPFWSIFPLSQFPAATALRSILTRELSRREAALPELRVPR